MDDGLLTDSTYLIGLHTNYHVNGNILLWMVRLAP